MKYILLFTLGLLFGLIFTSGSGSKQVITKLDTIHHQPEVITLEKVKTKIKYVRDTVIKTRPFIASIDTVIKHDTVYADFRFPEREMNIAIKQATDTVYHNKQIFVDNNEREWWEDPAIATGGLIIGYIIAGVANE